MEFASPEALRDRISPKRGHVDWLLVRGGGVAHCTSNYLLLIVISTIVAGYA